LIDKQNLGKIGEDLSVDFLRKKGFKILSRNWRYKKAEVDIIAKYNSFLVFIEVKCRTSSLFGRPEQAINNKKEKLYQLAAEHYLEKYTLEDEIRFDVISVIYNKNKTEIEHFINAF
jgi:putative endonuclease